MVPPSQRADWVELEGIAQEGFIVPLEENPHVRALAESYLDRVRSLRLEILVLVLMRVVMIGMPHLLASTSVRSGHRAVCQPHSLVIRLPPIGGAADEIFVRFLLVFLHSFDFSSF